MIKSISYWSLPRGLDNTLPIDEALAQTKAHGFDGLELAVGLTGEININTTPDHCERLRAAIDKSSLTVQTLASGMAWGMNPVADDPATRRDAIDAYTKALRVAGHLGCEALLYIPGIVCSPIKPGPCVRYDQAVQRAREAIDQLLPVAEEAEVDLCLENVWNGMFYSPLELGEFIDSFASDRLGVYFDVGNVLGYHQYPPHWIELLGERLKRIHIKDYKQTVGGLKGFCQLLEGDVPWEPTMAALERIGYDKTIVAEMIPHKPGLLEHTSAAMDRILSR